MKLLYTLLGPSTTQQVQYVAEQIVSFRAHESGYLVRELWSLVMIIKSMLQASLNGDDSNTSIDEAYSNSSLPGLTPEINANQVIVQFPFSFR